MPHLDTGNTGFMLLCTSLVMLMTPGLAFFYGGLVGRKNVLAIMMQSFVSMGWTTVLWWLCGFSMCFIAARRGFVRCSSSSAAARSSGDPSRSYTSTGGKRDGIS